MRIYTIGFTKKSARQFFEMLRDSGAKRIIDVRLNNMSQLAGFAKRDDLAFFAERLCAMGYLHMPELAPVKEMLDQYKKRRGTWEAYENAFLQLMRERKIEDVLSRDVLADACLLCSENQPDCCHRRLVAEYLREHWGDVDIVHLV